MAHAAGRRLERSSGRSPRGRRMRRSFSACPPLRDILDSTSGNSTCMRLCRLLSTNDHPSKHSHGRCVRRSVAGCRRLGINNYDPHGRARYCQTNGSGRHNDLHDNNHRYHLDFDRDTSRSDVHSSVRPRKRLLDPRRRRKRAAGHQHYRIERSVGNMPELM